MSTTVGYTGGTNPAPTYESVCDGDGHTEALQIVFNVSQTTYEDLLQFYWKQYHGNSRHQQYKAAIWVHDEDQRQAALRSAEVAAEVASKRRKRKASSMVEVLDAAPWYDAEEYHQKYWMKAKQRRMPQSFPKG